MSRVIFVTGTDTEVGKTFAASALIRAAGDAGIRVVGFKPVAAGCEMTPDGLRNDDAEVLRTAATVDLTYAQVNPVALEPAVAPHLAAETAINIAALDAAADVAEAAADLLVVEGAGGWQVPLNDDWTMAQWVARRGWPVLLLVGMRLGCLNHALLTAADVARTNRLIGWVGNVLPPEMPRLDDNMATLRNRLPGRALGQIPPGASPGAAAGAMQPALDAIMA